MNAYIEDERQREQYVKYIIKEEKLAMERSNLVFKLSKGSCSKAIAYKLGFLDGCIKQVRTRKQRLENKQ